MAKIACYLLLIIATSTTALICKNCNVACDNPIDEECIAPGETQDIACLTETFKDVEKRVLYQLKCVLYQKGTEFECVRHPNYATVACEVCKTDLCNKITNSTIGGTTRQNATTL